MKIAIATALVLAAVANPVLAAPALSFVVGAPFAH